MFYFRSNKNLIKNCEKSNKNIYNIATIIMVYQRSTISQNISRVIIMKDYNIT